MLKLLRKALRVPLNGVRFLLGIPTRPAYLASMTLDEDDLKVAQTSLEQPESWFDDMPVLAFENAFQTFNQSKYAFSFMGGRVALSACIAALDLKKGDKVLVPGFTCVVVPNAFWYEEIEVVFYDIELQTFGPELEDLQNKHKQHPEAKAVLIHHLFGIVAAQYEAIVSYCKNNNLLVIEDCAHSAGAKLNSTPVGNLGDVAFYSSEQSKTFNTFQGGIATTNSASYAKKMKAYQENVPYPSLERTERLIKSSIYNFYVNKYKYEWLLGFWKTRPYKKSVLISTTKEEENHIKPKHYACKMPAPLAKLGINQLQKLPKYNAARRTNAKRWEAWCEEHNYSKPLIIEGSEPVYLRYPVLVSKEMKSDKAWAKGLNIRLGVWFVSYLHPVKYEVEACPNCTIAVEQLVNFPTIFHA